MYYSSNLLLKPLAQATVTATLKWCTLTATRPPNTCIISIYIYIYIRIHTCTYVHIYIYRYIHIHTYTHTYIQTYIRTYVRTYIIHTYIHTYIYIYASTYIIYLSLCVSVCLRVSLCASVFLRVSLCVSVCLSDCLSVCPSVCLSVSLALSVSLSRRSQGGRTLHASHACGPQVVDSTKDLSCGGSAGRVAQLCIFSLYRKGFSADSKARRNNLATPQDLCLSLSHCLSVSGSLRQTKGKLVRLSGKTLWARGHRSLRSRANAT